ncbi:hypothetical protein ACELLULO517_26565 [Acidisoma cellulosilytica]|uniref:Uncharacterized protein n=1 Tax=Acidisoma cellulosilyticum TaxID=2802395 RepID=A0A963Z8K4_9PROT|nr:hypothetical protein [Acidisoma cellulosilyticum]MCB8883838.1 hypothetical protein [Acidisoma cellulosilyticum]
MAIGLYDRRRSGRAAGYVIAAACLVLLLYWRCPTVISHARLWGEDGWVWYPTCYAQGLACLTFDHSGYLQTISMLVALLSQLWPLTAAPTVFAVAALLLQASPAIFLLSPRMTAALPSLPLRGFLAVLLIAVPGMSEVYVNVTNTQWHLALLAFLIITANPAGRVGAAVFDSVALVVAGLSGPFAIFLAPVAALWWWLYRGRWRLWRLAVLAASASLQFDLVIRHQQSRGGIATVLGTGLHPLSNIVVTDVLAVATLGWRILMGHYWDVSRGWLTLGSPAALILNVILMLAATAFLLRALWRGPWILRAFLLFAALEFAAVLTAGQRNDQRPLWLELELSISCRYFFHPVLAWLAVLICLCGDRNWLFRAPALALIAVTLLIALPHDWALRPLPADRVFHDEALRFATLPAGTVVNIPVQPVSVMRLIKR